MVKGDRASERVAVNAGFELANAVRPVPGTGQVSDDLLVILMHGAAIRSWNYALYCGVIAAGISVLVMLLGGLLAKRTSAAAQPAPAGHAE